MRLTYLLLSVGFLVSTNADAGDWPMWRYDAGRGAATPEKLAKTLHLQWVRELPKPRPAWPATQTKLRFDQSYEPVVMGTRMFVGSSADDSVRAYSTRDGKELWRYFTDGPVRFAPVAVDGRVYVTSDDGHLHCLNAADGKLVWKVNGGPAIRPIIGNHRLVSTWPARGGPVYADGTVYFAASIWPSMGIFVHAVDAKTGHIKWTNSKAGSLFVVHPHGAPAFGSVVPQGHLVINGDALIVPGGRSSPAVFDRKTGELKYFKFDKRVGDHRVMSRDGLYFVAGNRYRLQDGRAIGSATADVLTEDLVLASSSSGITATELKGKLTRTIGKDRRGRVRILYKYNAKTRWTLKAQGNAPTQAQLVAGDQIFTASKNRIASFPLPKSGTVEAAANWSTEINGNVWSMLAADGRLFVVTVAGLVYCFGETEAKRIAQHHPPVDVERRIFDGEDDGVDKICKMPRGRNADRAFCIIYGLDKGGYRHADELPLRANVYVVAIDSNENRVRKLRDQISRKQGYGEIASARVGNGVRYPLPPYMASYIVCEDPKSNGIDFSVESLRKLYRPLRPYGGVACLKFNNADHAKFVKAVKVAGLANAEVSRDGHYTLLKRVGPLPKTAGWTHQYGDAANTVVSQDDLVKAPLGVLWFGGPSHDKILPRHGHGPNPQIAGGRLVIEGPDLLRAVDVYTGRLLWEKELKGLGAYYNTTRHFAGAGEVGTNYVTMPDSVYAVYGHRIIELDAATGKERKSFTLKAEPGKTPPAWGYAAVSGDYLIATSDPVKVAGSVSTSSKGKGKAAIPKGFRAIIGIGAKWRYLAGKDPADSWRQPAFDDSSWKTGKAGFGFGDGDDRTKLKMQNKYTRVYIRRVFDAKDVKGANELTLMVNYDDGFIAYLNGKEIIRAGIKSGSGANASKAASHEAEGFERFPIHNFRKLLRPGKNVLAIEGHNRSKGSSDFSLDPVLVAKTGKPTAVAKKKQVDGQPKQAFEPAKYSSASKKIVVFNRKTGELLWQLEAKFNFRHNCVIATPPAPPLGKGGNRGIVFCIDGASPRKIQMLKRRGIDASGKAKLLALDIKTGKEIWSTDKDVFGTFLNYSKKHDVLLQAGSAYRDRAKDEVSRGMVAYNGTSGKVLWADRDVSYGGPCLLWRDKIITNGGGGYSLELLTGKKTGWSYSRMYGCNTAVGSKNLLTFRSGAAGFYDLTGDSGTGNIGGFRSSCTSNLIAADGVLNAPDYTRTCSCAYQNQTSLALIHMPENDFWTFNRCGLEPADARRIGFNLGAPGDRRAKNGTLWFDAPSVGGPSPGIGVKVEPESAKWFRRHSSYLTSGETKWIAASGVNGVRTLTIQHGEKAKESRSCTVRLHFAEHQADKAGERVFSIRMQGKAVASSLDVFKTAGGKNRQLVREFRNVTINGTLKIEFAPSTGTKYPPLVCGVEVERK